MFLVLLNMAMPVGAADLIELVINRIVAQRAAIGISFHCLI